MRIHIIPQIIIRSINTNDKYASSDTLSAMKVLTSAWPLFSDSGIIMMS